MYQSILCIKPTIPRPKYLITDFTFFHNTDKRIYLYIKVIFNRVMLKQEQQDRTKIVFVARVARMKQDKFMILIPKGHSDIVRELHGKQVKVTLEREF